MRKIFNIMGSVQSVLNIHLIFWILISSPCQAGVYSFGSGARSAGMAHSSIMLKDLWAVQNNPAGLAYLEKFSIGLSYANQFLIRDLSNKSIAAAFPTGAGVFGFSFSNQGITGYSENIAGLSYSRLFGRKISAGLQLIYIFIQTPEQYKNQNLVTFAAGSVLDISNTFSLAFHVFHPIPFKYKGTAYYILESRYELGCSYDINKNLLLTAELEATMNYPIRFKAGMEYAFVDIAAVRAGFGLNPSTLAFGFGLNLGRFTLDVASIYHHILGFSPTATLIYRSGK